jgi:cytochrome b6-f complex iron-sulfur subunit
MDRRAFMNWVGVGFIASFLPVAIAACDSDTSTANNSSPNGGEATSGDGNFQPIAAVSDLDATGQLLNEASPVGPVLLIRDPNDANGVVAVNPTCPHAGCAVTWNGDQGEFVCPCHGSRFDVAGAVVQGPASKPLASYAARVEGDQVLVQGS